MYGLMPETYQIHWRFGQQNIFPSIDPVVEDRNCQRRTNRGHQMGREGGIEGDRGGETRWGEGRQVGRASTSLLLYLSRVFDSGGPRARELQLGEQARQPLINNSAGRWRRGGRGRPDRSGLLAASPSESVGPPPPLAPPAVAAVAVRSMSRKAPYYCAYNKSLLHCSPAAVPLSPSLPLSLSAKPLH